MSAYASGMVTDPSRLFEAQARYWGEAFSHYVETQQNLIQGVLAPAEDDSPSDPRFSNALWSEHPYFNFVKQQYLMSAKAVTDAVEELDDLEDSDKKRLRYFTRQIVDMMSPTNFLSTNPDALTKAVETQGQSLVDGLENLVRDIEKLGRRTCGHAVGQECLQAGRQYRDDAGFGGVPKRDHGVDSVHADNQIRSRNTHRSIPALD